MSAIERAEDDMKRGDYAMARQRLDAYLDQNGYDPEILDRLAKISILMHDPYSAGKYLIISSNEGPNSDSAIGTFLSRAGRSPTQIMNQLPRVARRMPLDQFPEAVRQRLFKAGLGDSFPVAKQRRKPGPRYQARLVGQLAFVTIILLTLGSCSLGLKQILNWFIE